MTMRARTMLAVLVTLLLATAAFATPLDDYVAKPDPSYTYSLVKTIDNPLGKVYIIDMKSQTWRSDKEVNRTLWQHWVTIIVPNGVTADTALLWINGGSNRSNPPGGPDGMLVPIALQTKTVVVDLKTVPNEPLVFSDDPGNQRSEDAIIAYTFDKFVKTGDGTWPLLLPMVKSAVRAMDTVQDFVAKTSDGKLKINQFVVSGGSKRGWTTWLTAAVDKRVRAIAPAVIDVLNMDEQMRHHFAAYGFYSTRHRDYQDLNVFSRLDTPQGQKLDQLRRPLRVPRPLHDAEIPPELRGRPVLPARLGPVLLQGPARLEVPALQSQHRSRPQRLRRRQGPRRLVRSHPDRSRAAAVLLGGRRARGTWWSPPRRSPRR